MICREHQLGQRGEPPTLVTAPGPGLMRAGLYQDVVPAVVRARSRSIIEDNVAGTGVEEPKPRGLGLRVRGEHAQQRVVKAVLGGAVAVTVQLKAWGRPGSCMPRRLAGWQR